MRRLISTRVARATVAALALSGLAATARSEARPDAEPTPAPSARNAAPTAPLADAAADPSPGAAPRFVFGRTAAVFRQAPDAVATRIGGWADASYRDSDVRGSSLGFDHVNLFLDSRYRDFQLFFEGEFERETKHTGYEDERDLEIEQVYLRWRRSDHLSLRLGRFNSSFGYWVPVHWSILMDTIEDPLHVGRHLVPEQQVGLEAAGRFFPRPLASRGAELSYAVYLGWGSDALRQDAVEGIAGGGDLRLHWAERYLLGASVYQQRNDEESDRTERSAMLYGEAVLPFDLTFRSELLFQHREERPGSRWDEDIQVFYAKLRWDFRPDAYLNYRFTHGDDDEDGLTTRETIHTVTLGYRPRDDWRIKLEYSDHDFRGDTREDFAFWGFSVGVLF